MIMVNTGDGKGKTTASIGQIIRSLGHGNKVCLIQLFKGEDFYGEQKILAKLEGLDFYSYASRHPFCVKNASPDETSQQCVFALKKLAEIASAPQRYDLIVLEEFNIALRDNFIETGAFLELLKKLSEKADIVITGRGAPQKLQDMADLVTEMKEIKHPYRKGVPAKKGIEF